VAQNTLFSKGYFCRIKKNIYFKTLYNKETIMELVSYRSQSFSENALFAESN